MFSMYSIGDGKRKLIYSYKTLESLKLKPYKNIKRNFLVLNNSNSRSNKNYYSYEYQENKYSEENPSKFFLEKSKKLKTKNNILFNKKVDILLNKIFDKSANIRHYNSEQKIEQKKSKNLIYNKFPKINCKSQSIYKSIIFRKKIKNNIISKFNQIFPEKYINSRERTITNEDKKYILLKKKNNFEDNKKLYKIKYLKKESSKEKIKELKSRNQDKLITKFLTIYNLKNKRKLLFNNSKDKPSIKKSIDVGLNKYL